MFYKNIDQMIVKLEQTLCNEQYTILAYIPTTKVTKRRVIDMLKNNNTVYYYERFISFINTFLLDQRKLSKLETYISLEDLKHTEYNSMLSILKGMTLIFALTDHLIRRLGNNINEKFRLKFYEKIKSILVIKQLYNTFTKFSADTLFNIYSNHISKLMARSKYIISTDDLPSLNMTIETLFSIYNKFTYKQNKPFFSKYVAIEIYERDLVVHCLVPNFDKLQFTYVKNKREHFMLTFPDYHYAYFKVISSLGRNSSINEVYMKVLNKNSFEDESQINLLSSENIDLIYRKSMRFPFNTYKISKVCLGDIGKKVNSLTVSDIGHAISMVLFSGLNDDLTDCKIVDKIKRYNDSDVYYLTTDDIIMSI